MNERNIVAYILVLTIIPLTLQLPNVASQASSTTTSKVLVAGMAVVKPSIDGVWQVGEWNDANEYKLPFYYGNANGKGEAYFRIKYDNASLYWLIDVPSDNGSVPVVNGQKTTTAALIRLDLNIDGYSSNDPADSFLAISTNYATNDFAWFFGKPSWSSQVNATQELGLSTHSSQPHRIYEISMPLTPLFHYGKRGIDNLPAINVDVLVSDSYGNLLDLLPESGSTSLIMQLELGMKPVAENIQPIIPIVLAVLVIGFYSRRKNRAQAS